MSKLCKIFDSVAHIVFANILLGFIVFGLITDEVPAPSKYSYYLATKAEEPDNYWLFIGIYFVCSLALFYLGFSSLRKSLKYKPEWKE
ncbi:hypothetical protein [Agarilytica rhodophyticola]|uniref:hypothetical protein n=1 Tax=Agarilytica rhodophyticola TaxID=1737490 RepID=UPI000B34726C|nr:hypothetical protein [Agarilytica rhodophyticola]